MKIKTGELRKIHGGLIEILKIELPVKPSYWLARIATKVEPETATFERARMGLILKYANKNKKGELVFLKDKNGKLTKEYDIKDLESFNKEFNELAEQEIEINIKPIKLDALGDVKIKPIILAQLEKIIEI